MSTIRKVLIISRDRLRDITERTAAATNIHVLPTTSAATNVTHSAPTATSSTATNVATPPCQTSPQSPSPPPTTATTPTTTGNRQKWTEDWRRALIELCILHDVKRLSNRRKWHIIAKKLEDKGIPASPLQCKNQWTQEMQKYREMCDPPTGSSTPRPYIFLDTLQNYMGDDPAIRPVHLVSSIEGGSSESVRIAATPTTPVEPSRARKRKIDRRQPKKDDIMRAVNDVRMKSKEYRDTIMSKYEDISKQNTLIIERLVRIEERRVEIEERRVAIEERRLAFEEKMMNVIEKLTDDGLM